MHSAHKLEIIKALAVALLVLTTASSLALAQAAPELVAEFPNQTHVSKTQFTSSARGNRDEEKAQSLWDTLKPEEKVALFAFVREHDLTNTLPSLISMLRQGDRASAVNLLKRIYVLDDAHAARIVSFISYANGIE